MQEETGATTFSKIFRTIWRQKWVALIVGVLIALFSAIILFYGYNPVHKSYVMEFSLNLPGQTDSVVYIYPNGTQFYYSDMTSLKTLQDLKYKKKDAAFENVDVEKMANEGHINIKRDITIMTDNNEAATSYREIAYTISVKATYFKNENDAKKFLIRLANTPADYLSAMTIDYGVYLNMAQGAQDYETEIDFLKAQLNDVQKKYATLISTYGDSFVVDESDGKTILAYSQEVEAYNNSKVLDNLLTEARKDDNYFIKDENYKENYRLELVELKKERDKAQKTLETLLSISGDQSSTTVVLDASVIKAQQDLVIDLDNKIKVIENYIEKGTLSEDYDNKVDDAFNKVKELTEGYSSASATVYGKASSVVYLNPGIVASHGGLGIIHVIIISFFAGIVIALIAGYVAGYLTLRKERPNGEQVSAAPETEPQEPKEENEEVTDEEAKE